MTMPIINFYSEETLRFKAILDELQLTIELFPYKSQGVIFRVYHHKRMVGHKICSGQNASIELKSFLKLYTGIDYDFLFKTNHEKALKWCQDKNLIAKSINCCDLKQNQEKQILLISKRIYCKVCNKEIRF